MARVDDLIAQLEPAAPGGKPKPSRIDELIERAGAMPRAATRPPDKARAIGARWGARFAPAHSGEAAWQTGALEAMREGLGELRPASPTQTWRSAKGGWVASRELSDYAEARSRRDKAGMAAARAAFEQSAAATAAPKGAGWVQRATYGVAGFAAQMVERAVEALPFAGAMAGATALATAETGPGAIAGGIVGGVVGLKTGVFGQMVKEGAAIAHMRLEDEGITGDAAMIGSGLIALPYAAIEYAQTALALTGLPKALTGTLGRTALAKRLGGMAQKQWGRILGRVLAYGTEWAGQVGEEVLQDVEVEIGTDLAKLFSGVGVPFDKGRWKEIWAVAKESAKENMTAMAFTPLISRVGGAIGAVNRRRAARVAKAIEAEGKAIEASTDADLAQIQREIGRPGEMKDLRARAQQRGFVAQKAEVDRVLPQQPPAPEAGVSPAQQPAPERATQAAPEDRVVGFIKRRLVDPQMEEAGLPPLTREDRLTFLENNRRAEALMAADTSLGDRTVAEFKRSMRPPRPIETAILLRQVTKRNLAWEDAQNALNALPENAPEHQRASMQRAVDEAQGLYRADQAVVAHATSQLGQSLGYVRAVLDDTYSIAEMTRRATAANGGKALGANQRSQIEGFHNRISKLRRRVARRKKRLAQNLQRSIDKYIARLERREIFPPAKLAQPPINTPEIVALRETRDSLKSQIEWLQRIVRPEMRTAEQRQLDRRKVNLQRRFDELSRRIAAKEFETKARAEPLRDADLDKLEAQLQMLKDEFEIAVHKYRLSQRTMPQKIFGLIGESWDLVRTLIVSSDLPPLLRQGAKSLYRRPIVTTRAWLRSLPALFSEEALVRLTQEMQRDPDYARFVRAGVDFTSTQGRHAQMEELKMSRWANLVPFVAASGRGYTMFLNRLRFDMMKTLEHSLTRNGAMTDVEGRILANFVNVTTGRGSLGRAEMAATWMNRWIFAPRLLASQVQFLAGQPLWTGVFQKDIGLQRRVRWLIAKEYARYLTGTLAVYALAHAARFDIEDDWRSALFGQIRVGNTWMDPLGGAGQILVLGGRYKTGEKKTLGGRVMPITGDVGYGDLDVTGLFAQFARKKLSPMAGAIIDWRQKRNLIGQPVTPKSVVLGLTTPLVVRDIYQAMRSEGIPAGMIMGLFIMIGANAVTIEPQPRGGGRRGRRGRRGRSGRRGR